MFYDLRYIIPIGYFPFSIGHSHRARLRGMAGAGQCIPQTGLTCFRMCVAYTQHTKLMR